MTTSQDGTPPVEPTAFIFGCARSGTSILGELIGSHPGVTYIHEAHNIWRRAGEPPDESHRLIAADATPEITRRLRKRIGSEREDGKMFIEKNPRHSLRTPFLRAVFPEAKLIHIYRDGRDVACSLLAGIGGEEWNHLRPPGWRELFAREEGILRCAYAWKEVMEVLLPDLAGVDHCAVAYEELVAAPVPVAQRIFDYLGLDLDPAVVEFSKRIQNKTSGSYHAAGQSHWYRDDHAVRIGRWRENLSDADANEVELLLRPLLDRLGYD